MKKLLLSKTYLLALSLVFVFGLTATNVLKTESVSALSAGKMDQMSSCVDDYKNWTYSNTYTSDVDWSLDYLPFETSVDLQRREQYLDLNGDGMLDYYYAKKSYGSSSPNWYYATEGCVLLNNGSGWDMAYQCKASTVFDPNTGNVISMDAYGDCADTSS